MRERHPWSSRRIAVAAVWALTGALACDDEPRPEAIKLGLLLSYSGPLAANSVNSERALHLAVESANAAGAIGGRPFEVIAGDTRSDPARATPAARRLVEAGAVMFLGADTPEIAIHVQSVIGAYATILPSFATASGVTLKPDWWFVMGPTPERMACELAAQVRADGRGRSLIIVGAGGYSSQLGEDLNRTLSAPVVVLPRDQAPTTSNIQPILSSSPDAYVLATLPSTASSLVYAMAALGAIKDPTRWYLAPTLHTPAFLETIPRGLLDGARGVAPGTVASAADFRLAFRARWHDEPLDDAYAFYDAGAVAVLALARAVAREGLIPTGAALGKHVSAVTRTGGSPVHWNELGDGLALLRSGNEVRYSGLSGPLEFDFAGQTPFGTTKWWTIGPGGFVDIPQKSDCD